MKNIILASALAILAACGQENKENKTEKKAVDTVRATPKTEAVTKFEQPISNGKFSVALYETGKTFTYTLSMELGTIKEDVPMTFPNIGIEPKPEIRKGEKDQEAIIGFFDDKGTFREWVKAYSDKGELKLLTLKHYAVYSK